MVATAMATDLAIDRPHSKMILGFNAIPVVKVSTTQYQQGHMMTKNGQEDIGDHDADTNNSLDRHENFSLREYVFSVRAKNIRKNWPFSQKYLQTCLENGRQPLLPPFESHRDILQEKVNKKENMVAGNDIQKIDIISTCSNKKIEDPKDAENVIYREGWIKRQKNCRRKKKMVRGKAREDQTSIANGKEYVVDVEELTETKEDPIEGNEKARNLMQNDDECQETERDLMISCESQGMEYVPNTDMACSLDSTTGEHGLRQVSYEAIDKKQENQFELPDMHLNTKNENEVRKKKGKKMVTSELKSQEDNKKEQTSEKSKEDGVKNDDFGISGSLPDALVPKVCPVCRTFSSTSNTALNAHIDHCLSVESNAKKAGTKSAKPKVRAIKKRLLADIFAVAPTCTVEDLEDNTGEDQLDLDANRSPLDDLNWKKKTKRRQLRHKDQNVYVDTKGKKLRTLSKLKEYCQTEECQQKKITKKRMRAASSTSVQYVQGTGKVLDSISSKKLKKKVHAMPSAKHTLGEDTVKEKSTIISLVTACEQHSSMSGGTRVETKEKELTDFNQVGQEKDSCNKNDECLTEVLETIARDQLEAELHKSPSKSAFPSSSEVYSTIPGQMNNAGLAAEILEINCSPSVEVSEISNCKGKRHTSRLISQNEMQENVSRIESTSGSPTFEEVSRPNAESASQLPLEAHKLSKLVNMHSPTSVTATQAQSNLFVSTSCQDSHISFASHGAHMIRHPENRTSIDGHDVLEASTETPARVTGVSIQDPIIEVKHVPALHEGNEGIFSPSISISHEDSNPHKTLQKKVSPQRNSGTQCTVINDAAKERVKSVSLQKQTLRQNPTTQNDISCFNSATDASRIVSPSNRQFSSFARDPVFSNILYPTTNICASSNSTYLYNGLIVEQSKSNCTPVTSISNNMNSNNMWMTETEHSNLRNMKDRPQPPAQKFANISGGAFGHSVCSSSAMPSKGPPLTSQGNLLQKGSFQSKDPQLINHQSSFGSMKLTSVTVPQVVSASTLAKQLGEGKTAEEILHGCVMIEENSNACNSQSNHADQISAQYNSTNPLEKQIGSNKNLNNSLFGIVNGGYGGNQVVGVPPYAYTVQNSFSSNARSFTSGSLNTSAAAYSSGLVNNQGLDCSSCSSEPGIFGSPIVRLMGKNFMVTNKDGGQSKILDTNPTSMEQYPNASYLRLLGFTSKEKHWQDRSSHLGRSMESSITFDHNKSHTLEGVRGQESRLLWNGNGYSQQPTPVAGNLSEWLRNLSGSTSQSSVNPTLTSGGPAWSHLGIPISNMKFPSPHVSAAPVERRTPNRPVGANYQEKMQPSSALHSQSDHTVIVIDDSSDVDAVSHLPGLESISFSEGLSKFQEGNSVARIPNTDSMFGSGKTWPQDSCIWSSHNESTNAFGSNLQRAKEVQEELRRQEIINPGSTVQPSSTVHSKSEPEVIIIDDTPDEQAVANFPVLEPTSFSAQPKRFQEVHSDSKFRSGTTWPSVSSIPSHFLTCKESTLACGLNHQRAKEVQTELRRLGITNPGIAQSSTAYLKPMRGG